MAFAQHSQPDSEAVAQSCSVKKAFFFAKFTGKHLCQNLFFYKVAGLRPATSLKKRLWHSVFLWILQNFDFLKEINIDLNSVITTASKVSAFGVILVCIFPHSDWIRRDNSDQNNYKCDHFLHSVKVLIVRNMLVKVSSKTSCKYCLKEWNLICLWMLLLIL